MVIYQRIWSSIRRAEITIPPRASSSEANMYWSMGSGGDFNLIYQAEDKSNSNMDRAMKGHFQCFINNLELHELPLLGRRFTWSNEREAPTLVRLDRVL
jgi:thiamine monophosphate kinase